MAICIFFETCILLLYVGYFVNHISAKFTSPSVLQAKFVKHNIIVHILTGVNSGVMGGMVKLGNIGGACLGLFISVSPCLLQFIPQYILF